MSLKELKELLGLQHDIERRTENQRSYTGLGKQDRVHTSAFGLYEKLRRQEEPGKRPTRVLVP